MSTMTTYRPTNQRAANQHVTPVDANALFTTDGIDWPVSADETLRAFGYMARKTTSMLWDSPGIRSQRKTEGIRVGGSIRTYAGIGVVTRVGTEAGWYMLDGVETRWTIWEVREILMAA